MGKPKTAFIVSYNPAEYVKEYLWDLDSLSINTVLSQPQSVEQILKTFSQKWRMSDTFEYFGDILLCTLKGRNFFFSVQQATFAQWFYFMIMILFSAFCTASVFGDKTQKDPKNFIFLRTYVVLPSKDHK